MLRNTARSMNSPEPGLMEAFAAVTQAVRTATRQTFYGDNLWVEPDMEEILSGGTPADAADHSPLATSLGDFEVLGSELDAEEEEVDIPRGERKAPLSPQEWHSFFDETGRITNERKLRKKIFYGGVDPSIRREVWKYLLRYYPFDSTQEDRLIIRQSKAVEYRMYKTQWESITPEQESHHSIFRERKHAIDKDVVRTDRTTAFFQDLAGPNLRQLNDILVTYTFFNFDLGYVQGMNDLLSPTMMIMEDEVDSFWCFKGIMDNMADNFEREQLGMRVQLAQLREILSVLDRQLYDHMAKHDSLNMFFCFRWLLILFKREFDLSETQTIWEALWSRHMSDYFHLFIAAAILLAEKKKIIVHDMGFDETLRHVNSLAGNLNANEALIEAERLYKKYLVRTGCASDEELKARMMVVDAEIRPPKRPLPPNIFDAVRAG